MTLDGEIVIIMGYPAAGKSTRARQFMDAGYMRLNRDELRCSIPKLIARMGALYQQGKQRFVLDNTYPSNASRAEVVRWGKARGLPVRCIHVATSLEDAQYNAVKRMLDIYGKLLGPEEMKAAKNPNIFPPVAQYTYQKKFDPPLAGEGFSSLEEVPFRRAQDPGVYTNKAIILDYDGTLRRSTGNHRDKRNKLIEYPFAPEEVEILPNRAAVLNRCVEDGYLLLGVSNQSGIGKGIIAAGQAVACFERTNEILGVRIDYRFCPHFSFPVKCWCHKPLPGLGVQLCEDHKLDRAQTIMVGDLKKDAAFARALGCMFIPASQFFQGTGWRPPVIEVP
jgi:HAD superfamily hydrolase (TIGR01662 family)